MNKFAFKVLSNKIHGIDNVSVTMISSDDSHEYVHENSYKKHKWVDRIPENHGRSRATIVITANLGVTSYAIARISSIGSTFNLFLNHEMEQILIHLLMYKNKWYMANYGKI